MGLTHFRTCYIPGGKAADIEATHFSSSNAEVKNEFFSVMPSWRGQAQFSSIFRVGIQSM